MSLIPLLSHDGGGGGVNECKDMLAKDTLCVFIGLNLRVHTGTFVLIYYQGAASAP